MRWHLREGKPIPRAGGRACLQLRVWYAFVYFTRYKSVISKRKRRGAEQQSRLVNESVGEAKPLRIAKVRELFQSSLFGIQWVVGGRIRKQALLPITVAARPRLGVTFSNLVPS